MYALALSDQHGLLPDVRPCDLLLIAGDITPPFAWTSVDFADWLDGPFRRWLEETPAKAIVAVAGNHDLIFERAAGLVPADLPWTYLQDSETEVAGLRIWGTPWSLPFGFDWAYNADEDRLTEIYAAVPEGIDILVSHGPPYGYGDRVVVPTDDCQSAFKRAGSRALLSTIDRVRPQVTVFGHIHSGHGEWERDGMFLGNVAIVDDSYKRHYAITPIWRSFRRGQQGGESDVGRAGPADGAS